MYSLESLKKFRIGLILFFLLVLVVSPCLASNTKTITMWGFPLMEDDMEFFGPKIEAFEQENPGVKVKMELFPWKNRAERMITAVAAKKAPDTIYFNEDNYSAFADVGKLVPLDSYPEIQQYIDGLKPGPRDAFTWKGHFYVMPILQTVSPTFYNKEMFREVGLDPENPPKTWNDLIEYSQNLTRDINGDGKIDQWAITQGLQTYGTWWLYNPWLFQAGGSFLNEDMTKAAFNNKYGVEALEFVVRLFDNYIDPNDKSLDEWEVQDNFGRGRAAFYWTEQHFIRVMRRNYPDTDFGVGHVLKYRDRAAHGTSAGYGIFTQSKNPEITAKWIAFLTNEKNMLDFDSQLRFMTPRKALDEPLKEIMDDPLFTRAIEESKYGRPNLVHPETQSIMRRLVSAVQSAVLHEQTPQQALDSTAREVNKLLAELY